MVWVSIYVWSLKSQGIVAIIKLRIMKRIKSKVSSNYCKLCLTEKFYIIQYPDDNILFNRKSELLSKTRHQKISLLNNLKRNDTMDDIVDFVSYMFIMCISFCFSVCF